LRTHLHAARFHDERNLPSPSNSVELLKGRKHQPRAYFRLGADPVDVQVRQWEPVTALVKKARGELSDKLLFSKLPIVEEDALKEHSASIEFRDLVRDSLFM
jgi:hypothetical protein